MAKIKTIKQRDFFLASEKDLAENEKSKFVLRDLNPLQAAEVYDVLLESGKFNVSIKSFVKAAQLGIVSWENILGEEDEPIKFNKQLVDLLPVSILTEIGLEVLKNTFPEFQEALNQEKETEETEDPLAS